MSEDDFWLALADAQVGLEAAYSRARPSRDPAKLADYERRVTEVSRLLANRHISAFANTAEQLANHEARLRRIERKVHGLTD